MRRYAIIIIPALFMTISGCASVRPKDVGYFIGNIAGALLGGTPGAALGSLVGVAVGQAVDAQIDKQQEKKERTVLAEKMKQPSASADGQVAQKRSRDVERVWVDEQVVDGQLVPGHFEFHPLPLPVQVSRR